MKRLSQFFQPSLRRRILGIFVLVAILVLITASATYLQLVRVRQFSEQVSPTGQQMGQIQDFAISLSAMEADLEQFFVLRSVEFEEAVFVELGTMADILASLEEQAVIESGSTLPELAQATTQLETKVSAIMGESAANLSATQINLGILEAYDEVDNVKQLHGQLTEETLARLQSTAVQQQDIIAGVNQQSIAIGVVIFVIVLFASLFITRTLRPIGDLTQTTQAIAAGDLEQRAVIQSRDEIGALATNFNVMAEQVQDLIGGLEKRVADRVRDLELAADVSRRLATIRDLDNLLTETVELVRSRFNLYHAQLYLTDAAGSFLLLRAGTGDAGKEMIRRNHRLPLESTSINGAAAFEKQPKIIPDTAASALFRANPLLPETRSEMAVPLLIGNDVVGVLDLQSDEPNSLTEENMPAFNALASQLAIAIDNARLFTETAQAQAEIKAQTRLLARSGWQDFLDVSSQRERIGYTFDQINTVSLADLPGDTVEHTYEQDIKVADETIGAIQFTDDEGQHLTAEEAEIVETVAQLVAQRVENLRLLAETNRYRDEAEKAIRRLTHEGWEQYQETAVETGFTFDRNEVKPITGVTLPPAAASAVSKELRISGEPIGRLTVTGIDKGDKATAELVTAVARQLSAHVDSLRLTAQTEQALGQTEALYKGGDRIIRAHTIEEVLQALVSSTFYRQFDRHNIMLFNRPWDESPPESIVVSAAERNDGQPPQTPVGTLLELEQFPTAKLFSRDAPTLFKNIEIDERVDENVKAVLAALETRGLAIFPLVAGGHWIGVTTAQSDQPVNWDSEQVRQAESLVDQAATVIQTMRLLEETQKRADREALVNAITQKIQGTVTMESALQTTIQELGQAFQARYAKIKLATDAENGISN